MTSAHDEINHLESSWLLPDVFDPRGSQVAARGNRAATRGRYGRLSAMCRERCSKIRAASTWLLAASRA